MVCVTIKVMDKNVLQIFVDLKRYSVVGLLGFSLTILTLELPHPHTREFFSELFLTPFTYILIKESITVKERIVTISKNTLVKKKHNT